MTALNKRARQVQRYTNYGVDMMEWDDGTYVKYSDYLALLDELEAAEKRIAELEARDINIKRQAQALFEAIANPNDCYIPAYVRCLREALNGNSTGIGVKGE
ncbi:hypothetical protein LF824_17545 [Citrobacter freundii]|uniref:hypothetical protein n=1 Tax=Citrobacter freundii TaxID=546 RepID=UPI001F5FCDC3|nr:hypothetical protein [Citrobacter freundii]MCO5616221.1 hypothetical protein [Citrobacter freundii]MCO5631290.1 hypothetical protein [Citrobacter freundii]MCO5632428.1 hypothetical protein [Citrobacter freundii]MCO5640292.1 hypothetical protein [Citrobacter freundii]MCO5646116.1 hypothetical protein [Citrobacter freundii]